MAVGSSQSRLASLAIVLLCVTVPLIGTVAVAQDSSYSQASPTDDDPEWSFRKVRKVAVPAVASTWSRGPVDRFLFRAMKSSGLDPAASSSPRALVRRLYFDLIGLPPSPAVVERFVTEQSVAEGGDAALDRLVDRLIASPQFGERWGRHWLDVARFAESSGGGRSLMFKNAWRYRDYVIDSFNADRPFDQFLREQIAGDLLEFESDDQRNRQLIATGFLELGPTNYELQDKQLLRMEVIDEQIDTLGRVFMGMTLGCARCHDHKFDPIPTRDYYALAGIFGSTDVLTAGNVSGHVQRELLGSGAAAFKAHRGVEQGVKHALTQVRLALKGLRQGSKLRGIVLDDVDAKQVGRWVFSTSVAGYLGTGYIHDDNKAKGDKSVRFAPLVPKAGFYEIRLVFTSGSNRATNVPVEITHADGNRRVIINQRSQGANGRGFAAVGRYRLKQGRQTVIIVKTGSTDGHVIVDGLQLIPADLSKDGQSEARTKRVAALKTRQKSLNAELARLKKIAPSPPAKAMAVRDLPEPKDGHLHSRGLVRTLGEIVPRGFLTVCGKSQPRIPAGQSGRRQLAEWLTDPDHPLTARVYVNRVWHHLFGAGLVRTTDNFGKMGERPSHPDLLDWLARRFVDQGWSTKKLVRELVRSAVYRLRTGASSDVDPDNRLLSHANRRRLDAESLRDAILSISGTLDPAMGGMTIRKLSLYDYDYAFESRRRSVYVPRFRGTRLELFDVFDAADPNLVTGRRITSHVSTQALYLMNSPWLMQQADHAAARLLATAGQARDFNPLLDRAYAQTLGRKPSAVERRLARDFHAGFSAAKESKAWGQLFHTLFACLDFRYLD